MSGGAVGLLGRWALVLWLLLLLLLAAAARAQDEPPARVGRIAAVDGEVLLYDTESREWVAAARNRPLTQGDRLAVAALGSAELQVGATSLQLDGDSEIEATRLDDERLQFALSRGSVALRVHTAELGSDLEVFTPEARFQPLRAGLYRIDRRADTSSGTNWRGLLRATTRDVVLTVEPGQRLELGPEAGAASARWSQPASDAFAVAVLREAELAAAAPDFVSPEMTGVTELARHGSWQQHPEFGWAWTPSVVAPQWAPYRFGQWVWVQPWGWTWVDAAPWGFAPSHYGRWFWWSSRWFWTPGPVHARPVYAPAVVGWVDAPRVGSGARPGTGGGWVPLGPHEAYRPGYRVNPGHLKRLNPHAPPGALPPPAFVNRGVPGAVTVLPTPGHAARPPLGSATRQGDGWSRRPWPNDPSHPQAPARPPAPRRETIAPRPLQPLEPATAAVAPAQQPFGSRPPRPSAPAATGRERAPPAPNPAANPVMASPAPAAAAPAHPFKPAPMATVPQAAATPVPPAARPEREPGERRRTPESRQTGRER